MRCKVILRFHLSPVKIAKKMERNHRVNEKKTLWGEAKESHLTTGKQEK